MKSIAGFVWAAAFALSAAGGLGWTPASAQGAPSGQTGTLTGTVTDPSGAHVADATVRAQGPSAGQAQTDARGTFSIANLQPGFYQISVTKPGYETAVSAEIALLAGETKSVTVTLAPASFGSLRLIGSVNVRAGTFNTSTSSQAVVSAEEFAKQAQPQVAKVLDQVPGIQISYPNGSANGAVPGSITFPNIRGALSFETASLIDGHPVSVGTFGDYVTSFLNSYVLQSTEIVKGPGAVVPTINYAIGGTVNFRTLEPTQKPGGDLVFGGDNYGGIFSNLRYTGTQGRLGWALDYAYDNLSGALVNYPVTAFAPGAGTVLNNGQPNQTTIGFVTSPNPALTGIQNNPYGGSTTLVACCATLDSLYKNASELIKMRYNLSGSTAVTASYLGSQTTADQNANTSSQEYALFTPASSYPSTNPFVAGQTYLTTSFHPISADIERNNEPIFQGEIRTTLHNDTVLARAYSASISRLIFEGADSPGTPTLTQWQLWGTAKGQTFTGAATPVAVYDYYRQFEEDRLHGYSLQYDHPFAGGLDDLTLDLDENLSTTYSGSISGGPASAGNFHINLPQGSGSRFVTALLRGEFMLDPKLRVEAGLYENRYHYHVPSALAGGSVPPGTAPNFLFSDRDFSHTDGRLAFEYRPQPRVALRLAAGSAIAPPYLFIESRLNGPVNYRSGNAFATQSIANPNLAPETAFGYDLGGDVRIGKDYATVLSGDLYLTNLRGQFITSSFVNGTCTASGGTCTPGSGSTPIVATTTLNLANSRYEGIELALKRNPGAGFGYVVQGALQRAYPYNLPPCFYSSTGTQNCNQFNTNLGIIAGQNFVGGGPAGVPGGFNGVSNQSVPYAQGYGEVNYAFANGAYASYGMTYFGNNNSFNVKPFFVANASFIYPLNAQVSLQVSADNIFNQLSGLFPLTGAGLPVALPNGNIGLTNANVLGPRSIRFVLTRTFGSENRGGAAAP